jgi:hypothetical protein
VTARCSRDAPHDPPHRRVAPGLLARLRGATLDLTPVRVSMPYRRLVLGRGRLDPRHPGDDRRGAAAGLRADEVLGRRRAGRAGRAWCRSSSSGLYGGAIADAVDRRKLVLLTTSTQLLLSVVLVAQAVADVGSTLLLYGIVAVQAASFAIDSPARQAFVPRLLPRSLLPAANALKQVEFNLGVTVGPLLAGVLVARFGYEAAYGLDVLTFLVALVAVAGCRRCRRPAAGGGPGRRACWRAWPSCEAARCCS